MKRSFVTGESISLKQIKIASSYFWPPEGRTSRRVQVSHRETSLHSWTQIRLITFTLIVVKMKRTDLNLCSAETLDDQLRWKVDQWCLVWDGGLSQMQVWAPEPGQTEELLGLVDLLLFMDLKTDKVSVKWLSETFTGLHPLTWCSGSANRLSPGAAAVSGV